MAVLDKQRFNLGWHGAVSDASALLLRSVDLVRFVPDGDHGTSADLTFRALGSNKRHGRHIGLDGG